jgi:hypothetical protein
VSSDPLKQTPIDIKNMPVERVPSPSAAKYLESPNYPSIIVLMMWYAGWKIIPIIGNTANDEIFLRASKTFISLFTIF